MFPRAEQRQKSQRRSCGLTVVALLALPGAAWVTTGHTGAKVDQLRLLHEVQEKIVILVPWECHGRAWQVVAGGEPTAGRVGRGDGADIAAVTRHTLGSGSASAPELCGRATHQSGVHITTGPMPSGNEREPSHWYCERAGQT